MIGDQIEIDFLATNLAGTLHVSLPTDIIQLLGTSSVPVVVAGSVLGVFELGERLASQRAKDALSKWLLNFDVEKAKALPDRTQAIFQSIFGERHFSWTCFVRSVAFSIGAMLFIGLILFLISPRNFLEMKGGFLRLGLSGSWVQLAIWLPWSILIDYVSLFKTRFILGILMRIRRKNKLLAIAIVGIDFVVYRALFAVGMIVVLSALLLLFGKIRAVWNDIALTHLIIIATSMGPVPHDIGLFLIFFWAGFAPSIWLWFYLAALVVTRALLRSEKLFNWLRWSLDIEKNPFRSIGAVAATLAFVVSVAIILVSAEVSRISNAS